MLFQEIYVKIDDISSYTLYVQATRHVYFF